MISRCKFCKNGFFNTFFPLSLLSHTFYFENRPNPLSKIKENAFNLVRTFCRSIAKTSTVTPIFYFMILIRTVLPFGERKIGTNLCSVLLNCTDWAIRCRIARVQFNSTLERKVKTRALKSIFLVRKWINNTLKSNFVRYHMHHWKNLSFLSSFALRVVFVKGSKIAAFVSIVMSKRARWPPLFITFLSSSWLVTSVYQVSSTIYVRFFYWGVTLSAQPLIWHSHANKTHFHEKCYRFESEGFWNSEVAYFFCSQKFA